VTVPRPSGQNRVISLAGLSPQEWISIPHSLSVRARRRSTFEPCSNSGFVPFHLLDGPEADDHTLYASHAVWENRAAFEAWTKPEAFRAAHSRAGDNKPPYLDHPQFEGFEVRQTIGCGKSEVA
jgi:heme-degrading monooxygenase HmoA